MASKLPLVGVDVVDLASGRWDGRCHDTRFMQRVYTAREKAAILDSPKPDMAAAVAWGAKEAAYKIASKVRGSPPVFEHRSFVVEWEERPPADGQRDALDSFEGSVTYEDLVVPASARIRMSDEGATVIQVLGKLTTSSGDVRLDTGLDRMSDLELPTSLPDLLELLAPEEAEAVYSPASAAVRIEARRAIARATGFEESRVRIVCDPGRKGRRPPRVVVDGTLHGTDISLSHDGEWIAWAFALPGR